MLELHVLKLFILQYDHCLHMYNLYMFYDLGWAVSASTVDRQCTLVLVAKSLFMIWLLDIKLDSQIG